VFLIRRPSATEINRFVNDSLQLPLSYGPTGIVRHASGADRFDEQVVTIGNGAAAFERARLALTTWKHFNIGWVEVFPSQASIDTGTVVAVQIRHFGFWSLNGARVLYHVGGAEDQAAPQAVLARVGQPLVRVLQARFRRDSAEAMKRVISP
jgi:uncharacterized protein (UPF0548 family)